MPGNMQQAVFDCGCCVVCVDGCDCATPTTLQMEMYRVQDIDTVETLTLTYGFYAGETAPNQWSSYQTDPDLLGVCGWVGGFFHPDDPTSYVTVLLTCLPDDSPNQSRTRFRWYTGITDAGDAGFGEPNTIGLAIRSSWLTTDGPFCCSPWIFDFGHAGSPTAGVLMGDLSLKNDPFFCDCSLQTPVCCDDCCAEPLCGGSLFPPPNGTPGTAAPTTLNLRIENISGSVIYGMPIGYDETITIEYCEKLFSWGDNFRVHDGVWRESLCFYDGANEFQWTFIFNAVLDGFFRFDIKSRVRSGCTDYGNFDDLLVIYAPSVVKGCNPVSYTAFAGGTPGFHYLKVTVSE